MPPPVAVLFKTHEKPAEKIVYILETYDLIFEGKTRKHMLLPGLALACARRDRLQALAANVAVEKHKVEQQQAAMLLLLLLQQQRQRQQ